MLSIGDPAPDFPYAGTTLHQTLARGPVILYFYPADFTPVCTTEACMFRDSHISLAAAGITVIGVSPQNNDSHEKFKARYKLPFTLLADTNHEITRAYKATGIFGLPVPFGVRRVTYLIGADARITDRATGELSVSEHERLIARALPNTSSGPS